MTRTAAYLRLSRQDQEKEGDKDSESIENQRCMIREYAKAHGYEIVKEYADEDYSGLTDQRPAFQQMLRAARKGMFEVILAKSQSRFSRNMRDIERYLHRELPLLGVRFLGILDGTDTGNHANKKARQIYALINEWYCEDLSENVRAVLRQKMKEGQFIGSFAPYGYQKAPDDMHRLIVMPEEADVVQRIFSWYAEGKTLRAICRRLNQEQRKPPSASRGRPAAGWNPMTVGRILENRVYLGDLEQGKSETISYKNPARKAIPRQQWICLEHCHAAIIDKVLFERVQMLRKQRRRK